MSEDQALREGERRFVTVIFADMTGFTSLSERSDPEEMDALMSEVFAGFEDIVRQYEGSVEKYIGDAMVAVFGVPEIHEDDPARAVNAALDFLESQGAQQREAIPQEQAPHSHSLSEPRVGFRIGIHTGLITTGRRGQFDVVTGHAMAVAARLQEAAPVGGILVSEETREKSLEDFRFSQPEVLQLKGRKGQVRAYHVHGKTSQPFTEESVFIDRERVLEELLRGYIRHDGSAAGGYFVVGQAGIGKTRLVTRFLERIRELPNFDTPILRARARRFRRRSFAVVTDLMINSFGLHSEDPPEQTTERIRGIAGIDEETARGFSDILYDIETIESHARVFTILYRLFKLLLAQHTEDPYTVVVFVDNAQAIDPESLSFFRYLNGEAEQKPFYLFCDRDTTEALDQAFPGLEALTLGPLSHASSRELLERISGGRDSEDIGDEETLEQVLANAAGNPLFIREYAKLVAEQGGVSTLPAELPTTIQNIFLAGVQRFPAEHRELLRKLAAFVHSFSIEDAEYVQSRTEADSAVPRQAIPSFERAGILIREEGIYLFKHEVFKQALYNSILNHNKRILHRIIADRMQSFAHPHTGRLLHHLSRAEEWEHVRRILQEAADGSFNMEYLPYYDSLLEKLERGDHARRTDLLFRKCTILFNNGNSERADSILKQILNLAMTHQIAGAAANAYHILTAYNAKSYSLEKASFCGRKALHYYDQMSDTIGARRNVLKLLSQAELLRNRPEASEAFLKELDTLSPAEGHSEQISAYAERHILLGAYGKALEVLEPVISGTGGGSEDYRVGQLFLSVIAAWYACDFSRVVSVAPRLLRGKHRHYGYRCQAIAQEAAARHLLGEPGSPANRIQQAEFESSQIRNDFDRVDALRTIAEVSLIVGEEEKAIRLARGGITIGLRHSAYFPTFSLLMILVEIHAGRDEEAAARFFLEEASFLLDQDAMLRNRDRILYHYFAYRLGFDDAPEEHRKRATEHLAAERRNIDDEDLYRSFLRLRCFGDLARELDALPLSQS